MNAKELKRKVEAFIESCCDKLAWYNVLDPVIGKQSADRAEVRQMPKALSD